MYLILDEFILGGEFEETSKKVRRRRTVPPGECAGQVKACAPRSSLTSAALCCGRVQVILERLKELDSIEI